MQQQQQQQQEYGNVRSIHWSFWLCLFGSGMFVIVLTTSLAGEHQYWYASWNEMTSVRQASNDFADDNILSKHPFSRTSRSSGAASYGMRHPLRLVDILKPTPQLTVKQDLPLRNTKETKGSGNVQELYFTQVLDHFRINAAGKEQHEAFGSSSSTSSGDSKRDIDGTSKTFQQRYFLSTRFERKTKRNAVSFIFVCVGGEGPALDTSVLVDSVHCSGDMLYTAQQLYNRHADVSITLAALEHRYYGNSYPVFDNDGNNDNSTSNSSSPSSPVSNANLVYLSSKQATADLVHFIRTVFDVNDTHDTTDTKSNPKVVLFGGSYPGVLAAFSRLKYPHVIDAAVSNSAPVQAIVDFAAYQSHVGQVIRDIDAHCHDIVATAHVVLGQMVQQAAEDIDNDRDDIYQTLAQQFHLCNATALTVQRNQQLWLGDGVVYFGTQENDPSCNMDHAVIGNGKGSKYCDIATKCMALTSRFADEMDQDGNNATIQTASVAALAWLLEQTMPFTANTEDSCVDLDWDATVTYIADPVRGQDDGLRSWLWQTCTEFGFYQTCQTIGCPFAIGFHPLSQDLEVCERAFGIDALSVARAVQATNEYTGGWHMEATRIVSVTGTVDPWTEMSFQNMHRHDDNSNSDTQSLMPVYSVQGASHHFWTHPILPTDDPAVSAAREFILDTVQAWLFTNATATVAVETA